MAQVLRAYVNLCSRDVARVRQARSAYACASALPATPRERLHVAAIGAALADNFEAFRALLQELLQRYPRDVLALQVGHALDYVTGDIESMGTRTSGALPAWSQDVPGYHAVLAMHAFSLVECARYQEAIDQGLHSLELDPADARAHHALTHTYEMTGNAAGGELWMRKRLQFWAVDSIAATHCWWHWALFSIAEGEFARALEIYDRHVRHGYSTEIADLIDASSLLWRIELHQIDAGSRWLELASAWKAHLDDGYCTFNDLHAMLAQVGAKDWSNANRLESQLRLRQRLRTRYGETTRRLGLPACRAIIAYGRGDYGRAAQLLSALPSCARRLGGSQAQRDLLSFTLRDAVRLSRSAAPPTKHRGTSRPRIVYA
jgi:hypothetical protein